MAATFGWSPAVIAALDIEELIYWRSEAIAAGRRRDGRLVLVVADAMKGGR